MTRFTRQYGSLGGGGKIRSLARAWLLLAAGIGIFATLPALAQQAAADDDDLEDIEEVVVTGSRIARDPNLASVSPMTTVNAEDFVFAGTARTEDLLNDLPSIYGRQQSGQANGATGTATVDLRGLGTTRTLVLVNGRRLPPGTPGQGGYAADINQVPTALIERVDVLTGGSSATYGSDAIAGVVNFVTRQDFQGFRLDLQRSGYRHDNGHSVAQAQLRARYADLAARNDPSAAGYEVPTGTSSDGQIDTIAMTFGVNTGDDRGNFTGYFTYRDVEAVLQANRDYSRCDLWGIAGPCGGSGTIPNGRFTNFGALSGGTSVIRKPAGECPDKSTSKMFDGEEYCILDGDLEETEDVNEAFVYDFIPGTGMLADTFEQRPGFLVYNYNPTNFFQRPDKNTSAGFTFRFDITDNVEVYSELNYTDNHTQAQIAFSGNFFVTEDLFCGNPLMSQAQFETLCGQLGLSKENNVSDLTVFNVQERVAPLGDRTSCPEGFMEETEGEGEDAEKVCRKPDQLARDSQIRQSIRVATTCPTGSSEVMVEDVAYCRLDDCPEGSMPSFNAKGDEICEAIDPSSSQASIFIGKRNVEGGPRSDDLRHTSLRAVIGARWEINDNWKFDGYYMSSEVSLQETYNNDLSATRITRALDVVEVEQKVMRDHDDDPDTPDVEETVMVPVCRSVRDGYDSLCVPWNLFKGQGLVAGDDVTEGITQGALDYLRFPLFTRGTTDQDVLSFHFTGSELWQFPGADVGSSLVVGYEYRKVALQTQPDIGFQTGDGAGQGGATLPISGAYDVTEFFGELVMPILQGARLAEDLSLELAYRNSDYSLGHKTNTYKLGAVWKLSADWSLRGTVQRAVRTADIYALFLQQGNNLTNIADPCSQGDRQDAGASGPTFEQCARTGVTQNQYDGNNIPTSPAGQYNFLQGGNSTLEPEESDTLSIGVVAQPSWAPGLDVTVDYFDISIEKAIGGIGSQTILNGCLDGSEPTFCAFINRGPDGNLWLGNPGDRNYGYIEGLQRNLGALDTTGIDIKIGYTMDVGAGSLDFSTNLTYLLGWETEEYPGAGAIDCVGLWSGDCGDPTFEFQNNFRVIWSTPWDVQLTFTWRHISEAESLNSSHANLPSVDYFDIAGVWTPSFVEGVDVRFGINNLLDDAPPLFGFGSETFGNGNTFPGYYDALGQYWFVGLSYAFE